MHCYSDVYFKKSFAPRKMFIICGIFAGKVNKNIFKQIPQHFGKFNQNF